jgi:hypothetical protein
MAMARHLIPLLTRKDHALVLYLTCSFPLLVRIAVCRRNVRFFVGVTYDGVNIILIGRAPTTLRRISDLNLLVSVFNHINSERIFAVSLDCSLLILT